MNQRRRVGRMHDLQGILRKNISNFEGQYPSLIQHIFSTEIIKYIQI